MWSWLFAALLLCAAAHAAEQPLAVDQAFSAAATSAANDSVQVSWTIADGYYLYRHGFDFELTDAPGHTIGAIRLPDGARHTDEFFGEVETYRDRVTAVIDIEGDTPLPDTARLKVSYQGCADMGLCYPPQTRTLGIASESATTTAGPVAQQDALAARLAGAHTIATLALFFGLGVLLAFTPCILPMIPILSGLIVGAGAGPGRALKLSLAYVVAMACAYAVFGVIAGAFGANLQAALQMPAVVIVFAAVFVALALAAFGAFELQMPSAIQQRVGRVGQGRGGLTGAAVMGFFSALIAGPCLAPPLVGALLYISSSGDVLLGASALFMLGLGMGMPLLLIGTFGARLLPRAGRWMDQIRIFFGVVLAGVALWLVSRILDPEISLALWGLLALGYGAYLSIDSGGPAVIRAGRRALVFLLLIYAGCALVGASVGGGRPISPLAGLGASPSNMGASAEQSPFTRVDDLAELKTALADAAQRGRPAIVDFYADWCVECVQMEHSTFADSAVRAELAEMTALQVDVTDYDAADRALLRAVSVYGPPTMLFYRADGREAADRRVIGAIDAPGLLAHLEALGGP
ncbi:protein-disulfide reductase DsbD [Salinisphaera sp. T31B1]|uniref:protein-disulfide reductase DsbD n=1 Tax=Salinisphaera sp. T31B1 TaxID=727963 RepID=UPI003342314D